MWIFFNPILINFWNAEVEIYSEANFHKMIDLLSLLIFTFNL